MSAQSYKDIYHLACVGMACVLNAFLTYLILHKSPKKLGNYKYLMVYTSMFEAFYAIVDYFAKVLACSSSYAWFVVRPDVGMPHTLSLVLVVLWCGLFGVSQAIFAVHFVYRYGTLHKEFHKKYLAGRKTFALYVIPLIVGVHWTLATYYPFIPNEDNREYLRPIVLNLTGSQIEDVSYICAKFYVEDDRGVLRLNGRVWFGLANLWMVVLISMFCVFYLGLKCYRKIHSQLEVLQTVGSLHTARLQDQLFYALVVETLIPLVFMYIPCSILFSSAIFDVDVGAMNSLVTYTITLYPVIDPLPNMLLIKSYRKAIESMLKSPFSCSAGSREITVLPIRAISSSSRVCL